MQFDLFFNKLQVSPVSITDASRVNVIAKIQNWEEMLLQSSEGWSSGFNLSYCFTFFNVNNTDLFTIFIVQIVQVEAS